MLKVRIDSDLKQAMLSGDKPLVEVLRMLKSAILYKEVADGLREQGLDDEAVIAVLKKEQKSRKDAAALYESAGEQERLVAERYQLEVIDRYLPQPAAEADIVSCVKRAQTELSLSALTSKDFGAVIGFVKKQLPAADGAAISQVLKKIIEEQQ